ncbi:MAG TPA: cell division protein FtsJ [Methanomicrobia archaeon]|nr:cell division protein FtsJ [Methanomicrobia archaeon]HEX59906.1 cell division protein FtsJ [Methanomicrobia archaeon]
MRLDEFLVANAYVSSRSRAKFLIREGYVVVNGKAVRKPSYDVRGDEEVEVLAEDRPLGYWKLSRIQESFEVIRRGDVVLDLGSSAGGFLIFASEIADEVIGLEISGDFKDRLEKISEERGNVRVIFGDVFDVPPETIPELDVILNDLTLEPEVSIRALLRFLGRLKPGGRVLCVLKGVRSAETQRWLAELERHGLEVLKVIPSTKKETYVICKKLSAQSNES